MYASLTHHLRMNSDAQRNQHYGDAISAQVRPGDRVMDLGAGLGMLGFMAARRGAAVHFVEPEDILEVPRQMAAAEGLADCHFHQARVEDLPDLDPVDVIISVFTGNFLLTEDLLPSLFHARDRFLAPGGRLIPDRARMAVQPVSCPGFYQSAIEEFRTASAGAVTVAYPRLRDYLVNTLHYDYFNDIEHSPLADPAHFRPMDFYTETSTACREELTITVTEGGLCHGWLGWFDMGLGEQWLSTAPSAPRTHWRQVFLPLADPLEVAAGETLAFGLHRPERGDWTWTTRHGQRSQRMSTFLSGPRDPQRLRRESDAYRPQCNAKGEAAALVLALFDGQLTVAEIAARVAERFPALFPRQEALLGWVKGLVKRYS
ncbi:MAG: methyltransferase domain-containing protein [Pseudomonadota bacterium]|nr:methyltransferase domain-containing protein [Pseudomonadota bacterium]